MEPQRGMGALIRGCRDQNVSALRHVRAEREHRESTALCSPAPPCRRPDLGIPVPSTVTNKFQSVVSWERSLNQLGYKRQKLWGRFQQSPVADFHRAVSGLMPFWGQSRRQGNGLH